MYSLRMGCDATALPGTPFPRLLLLRKTTKGNGCCQERQRKGSSFPWSRKELTQIGKENRAPFLISGALVKGNKLFGGGTRREDRPDKGNLHGN